MKNYSFTKTAIVRTPIGEKQTNLTWEKIQEIFSIKEHREALFIGSPNIYKALVLWEKGEAFQTEEDLGNLKGSLYKYASRLSNRCTPFGMFSTVAAVDITGKAKLDVAESKLGRYTKFDMYFLGSFLPILTKEAAIRETLIFTPNNSLYTVFDKYRYVEYYFKDNVRFHKISEVEITDYLQLILEKSKNGVTFSDLIPLLVSKEISKTDAYAFINTLVESQFLISELEFTITGGDYFEKVIATFSEDRFRFHEGNVILKLLQELKEKINVLDQNISNDPSVYAEIHRLLEVEINEVDIAKLFQVDTFRDFNEGSISFKTLKMLRPAITALNKLNQLQENVNLADFKKKFRDRFEEYEQPLINVLDPDIGLGYGKHSGAKTPLVDELALKPNYSKTRQVSINPKTSFLLKKLIHATKNGLESIELTDEDINTFEEDEKLYPDSFSVFFNAFTENGIEKAHLKSVSGPTANMLIGRFSHLDSKIESLCDEIVSIEEQLNDGKIIAEIVHLPQARTGNILYRGFKRKYEIPFLGNASVAKENQILIEDLLVSVNNQGKIVLRSKSLNKEIIPRLSNAHNFSSNALPVYHFLCDLQNQDSTGIGFSWGSLQYDFDFLPRVTYKDVIFSKATWHVTKTEIETILAHDEAAITQVVRDFQKQRNIPTIINFTQGDNEVVINFDNELSCRVFFFMLKGEKFVTLTEFLFLDDTITDNFTNEIVVSAHRNVEQNKNETIAVTPKLIQKTDEASFTIGEKWLYYKFYCGERAAEELLNRVINPIVSVLKEFNLIDKWFFIRYHDANGHHLRFRILLKDVQHFTNCIAIIKKYTKPFEDANIIWKTQTDTYLREIQRYGYDAIEETETLFYNDSEATLQFVDLIEGDLGEKIRWQFCLLSMDALLNDFKMPLEIKVEILKAAKTSFGKEFNRSGTLNKQINDLFSDSENEIEKFLNKSKTDEMFYPLWEIIEQRSKANESVCKNIVNYNNENKLPEALSSIAISYLHMICNRLFLTKQRVHEMVVYDFLYKYYSKQLHTGKKVEKVTELKN